MCALSAPKSFNPNAKRAGCGPRDAHGLREWHSALTGTGGRGSPAALRGCDAGATAGRGGGVEQRDAAPVPRRSSPLLAAADGFSHRIASFALCSPSVRFASSVPLYRARAIRRTLTASPPPPPAPRVLDLVTSSPRPAPPASLRPALRLGSVAKQHPAAGRAPLLPLFCSCPGYASRPLVVVHLSLAGPRPPFGNSFKPRQPSSETALATADAAELAYTPLIPS